MPFKWPEKRKCPSKFETKSPRQAVSAVDLVRGNFVNCIVPKIFTHPGFFHLKWAIWTLFVRVVKRPIQMGICRIFINRDWFPKYSLVGNRAHHIRKTAISLSNVYLFRSNWSRKSCAENYTKRRCLFTSAKNKSYFSNKESTLLCKKFNSVDYEWMVLKC